MGFDMAVTQKKTWQQKENGFPRRTASQDISPQLLTVWPKQLSVMIPSCPIQSLPYCPFPSLFLTEVTQIYYPFRDAMIIKYIIASFLSFTAKHSQEWNWGQLTPLSFIHCEHRFFIPILWHIVACKGCHCYSVPYQNVLPYSTTCSFVFQVRGDYYMYNDFPNIQYAMLDPICNNTGKVGRHLKTVLKGIPFEKKKKGSGNNSSKKNQTRYFWTSEFAHIMHAFCSSNVFMYICNVDCQ